MWALLGVGIQEWHGPFAHSAGPCKAQVASTVIVSSDTRSFKKKKISVILLSLLQCETSKGRNLNSIVTDINHMEKKKKKRKTRTLCVEKEKAAAAAKASGSYIPSPDPFEIAAFV